MRQTLRDSPPAPRGREATTSNHATDERSWYKESWESQSRRGNPASDTEKADGPEAFSHHDNRRSSLAAAKDDPFGDEEGAEVKYRTLRWWYVGISIGPSESRIELLTRAGRQDSVRPRQ